MEKLQDEDLVNKLLPHLFDNLDEECLQAQARNERVQGSQRLKKHNSQANSSRSVLTTHYFFFESRNVFYSLAATATVLVAARRNCFRIAATSKPVVLVTDVVASLHVCFDVRDSVSMLRSGSPANVSGATYLLLAGKNRNPVYTDEYLVRHGAKKYSTIVMTPTGYLTKEAWAIIVPLHIKSIRHNVRLACAKLGIDKKTADELYVGQFFDGFGVHTKEFLQLILFAESNVLCAVENRDSSEFCQAFDKFVALAGKKRARNVIDLLRRSNISPIIDQWALVNVGLAMLRDCDSSNVWEASFIAVNMHPHHRVSFDDWMDRIRGFTRAAEKFDEEVIDLSAMLPKLWLHTPLRKRQQWLATVKDHNANFDVELIGKLRNQDMTLQLVAQMFKIYHCEKRIADGNFVRKFNSKISPPTTAKRATSTAAKSVTPARGTMIYHLYKVPEGIDMTREEKLQHAITVRNRTLGPVAATTVSPYLDVEVTPMNQSLLELKPEDVNMYNVLQQSTCKSTMRRKVAKRTLTALGTASGLCGILNGPEQLRKLKVLLSFTPALRYT